MDKSIKWSKVESQNPVELWGLYNHQFFTFRKMLVIIGGSKKNVAVSSVYAFYIETNEFEELQRLS